MPNDNLAFARIGRVGRSWPNGVSTRFEDGGTDVVMQQVVSDKLDEGLEFGASPESDFVAPFVVLVVGWSIFAGNGETEREEKILGILVSVDLALLDGGTYLAAAFHSVL